MSIDRRTVLGGGVALAALPAATRAPTATIRIATPMAVPDWAVLQRRVLAANAAAWWIPSRATGAGFVPPSKMARIMTRRWW